MIDNADEYWAVLVDHENPWPTVVFVGTREAAIAFERENLSDYESCAQRVEGPVDLEPKP